MFVSYTYITVKNEVEYKIIDSDFTVTVLEHKDTAASVVIAKEYYKRNLPVAKNMVLLCLYSETKGYNIKHIVIWQDHYCYNKINNWKEIAAERDRLLDKLLVMK